MHKIFVVFVSLLALLASILPAQASPLISDQQDIFYYSYTCSHCKKVEKYFADHGTVAKFNLVQKEISQNPANARELSELAERLGIPLEELGVPFLYFEGKPYIGDKPIIDLFRGLDGEVVDPTETGDTSGRGRSGLTMGAVAIAALADSVNPCAFAVIVFLLLSLIAIGSKKRMLKVGLVYIVTVYIVYLAAGLGLLASFAALSGISKYILWVAAALAIVAGLVNVKDFFWYGKGFTLAIPESKKPLLQKYVKQASLPAAIVLGFLVALFELPCTGGFYLAILALLSQQASFTQGLWYLVFYNLIFVAPLLVILLVVYRGVSPQRLEAWRVAKRSWMRLIMGIVLIALGLSLIFLF